MDGRQKLYSFSTLAGICPPTPPHRRFRPPAARKIHPFHSKTAGKRCSLKKHSIGFGICAAVPTSDYPEIYVGVPLTFRTLGIHHSVQKKISCFAAIVPLLHFSITDGCYSVTLCVIQILLVLRFCKLSIPKKIKKRFLRYLQSASYPCGREFHLLIVSVKC